MMDIYSFITTDKFLNSNILMTLVTLAVGLVALYIYRKQHNDERRAGAIAIFGEISSAETLLKTIKARFFAAGSAAQLENKILLPHESWSQYKFLYKDDLTPEEWDLLDNFYANCKSYDEAVKLESSYFALNTASRYDIFNRYHDKIVEEYMKEHPIADNPTALELDQDSIKKQEQFETVFLNPKGAMWYAPMKSVNDARSALVALDTTVSLSSAGQRIRKIARIK